ncbi:MAG: protein kinase domain-containing protein [Planctomycetota bacterium]|jgi:non-specific serine/threonine protein kinase
MIGQTVSHYKILGKLGEGGMGVVYKAEDTKLKRTVALKFLPPDLTRDKNAKTRFIHEAQAASALQHNNICTIHEIDESPDGRLFICMDCYDGKTLKEKIAGGQLPIDDAVDITIQVTEGLSKAHVAGMVHRDIKPANIMVTNDSVVKIVDFGLAKLAGQTRVTKTGTTPGTISYMSPEQAGGGEADQRSDIFSLGVTLYELLTGELPFHGDHEAAVLYGIMHNAPEPVSKYRNDVPADVERVIEKALTKDREERYSSAAELLKDLKKLQEGRQVAALEKKARRRIHGRTALVAAAALLVTIAGYLVISQLFTPERIMLAVLPFENLGPAEDEYFADGITDEITVRLANVRRLGVIARTSAFRYKNTDKSIEQIGEELGVDYVMEGSIRWQRGEPSRIRVTPQLISISDATNLWADVYDEILTEIFDVQSDIAEKVVSALNITLLEPERELIESKPTDNLEAYDYYIRGNEYFHQGIDQKLLLLSSRLYEKAIGLDSSFVYAYTKLSRTYTELYWHHERRSEYLARAKWASDKAVELSSDLPDVHVALGSYYYHLKDHDRALEEFALAEKGQPNNADLLEQIGILRRRQGFSELAIAKFERTLELDPRSALKASNLGDTYYWMREYAEAETYYDRAISLAPHQAYSYAQKARLYVMRDGDVVAAQRLLHDASEVVEPIAWFSHTWAWVDACAGDYEAALAKLTVEEHYFFPGAHYYNSAALYGLLGKPEKEIAYYDFARVMLEERVAAVPEDARYHSGLGVAYAGLGRKDDAIRERDLAAQLAPISQNASFNTVIAITSARIDVMVGEYDAATDQLEYLLSIPARLSIPSLWIDPTWAPLREHPRFQELLKKS